MKVIASLVLLFIVTCGACAWSASPQKDSFASLQTDRIHAASLPDGKLAMVSFMLGGNNKSDKAWEEALRRMRSLGVEVVEIGQISWTEIEHKPGIYDWGYAAKILRINKGKHIGLRFVADIGMFINPGLNGTPKLPAYLKNKSFDNPQVVSALSNLYKSFLALPGAENVSYLFQHFENADASFRERPQERTNAQKLLKESFAEAKKMRPDLKTGVCIQSYDWPHFREKDIVDWNIDTGCDIIPIISFDPSEFQTPGDTSTTMSEFEAILPRTHGLPIALNECGLHSSPNAGMSPEKQAQFVKEIFAVLTKHHDKIEFATWYELSDLHPLQAAVIGVYLGTITGNPLSTRHFAARMGSRGLLTHDNKVKPAARTWCDEAARYYELRRSR